MIYERINESFSKVKNIRVHSSYDGVEVFYATKGANEKQRI